MDREVDLVSPLVTPLTYEGLVDEVIGIINGKIKIDAALLGNEDSNDLSQMKLPSATVVVPGLKSFKLARHFILTWTFLRCKEIIPWGKGTTPAQ